MLVSKKKSCLQCFRMLADDTRMELIKMLQQKRWNVSELTKNLGVTQPTVSHHLKTLDAIAIVIKSKGGRETIYRFNDQYLCKGCEAYTTPLKA